MKLPNDRGTVSRWGPQSRGLGQCKFRKRAIFGKFSLFRFVFDSLIKSVFVFFVAPIFPVDFVAVFGTEISVESSDFSGLKNFN